MPSSGSKYMRFEDGAVQFQFSLFLDVIIRNIRAQEIDGQGHEASFYCTSFMTNGSSGEINSTGTQL
jgi:uncharacterized protein YijF (DUF1287 family)